jgi:hypothetical protein
MLQREIGGRFPRSCLCAPGPIISSLRDGRESLVLSKRREETGVWGAAPPAAQESTVFITRRRRRRRRPYSHKTAHWPGERVKKGRRVYCKLFFFTAANTHTRTHTHTHTHSWSSQHSTRIILYHLYTQPHNRFPVRRRLA